jgi:hypothetical protein
MFSAMASNAVVVVRQSVTAAQNARRRTGRATRRNAGNVRVLVLVPAVPVLAKVSPKRV